jgi:hypothetical protein
LRLHFGFLPIVAVLVSAAASAHHSPAMFDSQKTLTLKGTVRQFQWSSPHCYIQLVVTNDSGAAQEWSLEMGAPVYLYNLGWRPSTLKPTDVLTATVVPLRSGAPGALVLTIETADGRKFGGAPP